MPKKKEVKRKTAECPNGCDHTDREHEAFDAGFEAGRSGVDQHACPYRGALAEDWLDGHSAGSLDKNFSGLHAMVKAKGGKARVMIQVTTRARTFRREQE
jgi:ribosome modulation factor